MLMEINFRVGDTIKVYEKIKEGDKTRSHLYEGIVLAIRGSGINQSFIVRKMSQGVGIERIWPINSPLLEKIVIKKKGDVRRAKLYYLRGRVGKQALAVKSSKEEVKEEVKTPNEKPVVPTEQVKNG